MPEFDYADDRGGRGARRGPKEWCQTVGCGKDLSKANLTYMVRGKLMCVACYESTYCREPDDPGSWDWLDLKLEKNRL